MGRATKTVSTDESRADPSSKNTISRTYQRELRRPPFLCALAGAFPVSRAVLTKPLCLSYVWETLRSRLLQISSVQGQAVGKGVLLFEIPNSKARESTR